MSDRDVERLMDSVSDWLIDQAFMAGEDVNKGPWKAPAKCRWCLHEWHGQECTWSVCHCDGSHSFRDDSWRPRLVGGRQDRMAEVMHETGCDGFTAAAAIPVPGQLIAARSAATVYAYLYGYDRNGKAAA